ncbi:MAG: type II toxin-antitoxin system RelE/ParE family toxin [Defluviitaleaceae bacterium]|nr:type II toxin-antitoxin system RelE/ParE family toxin [Defluviitaleaceae bacterium]
MLKLKIKFERQAVKQIESLEKILKERIKRGIDNLPNGDVKKLQGYTATYRLRIGGYRIIYSYLGDSLIIKAVLPRGSAY